MIKGLYIHIPFCKRICSYCDFNKRVSNINLMQEYKDALIKEIVSNKDKYYSIETIYIGGGTPSFYPFLEDILIELKNNINLNNIKEFTIESTLETVSNLKPYINKYNINRISIGIESFNKETLSYINRPYYGFEDVSNIINDLRKEGIKNINLDFISGLPFETIESLKKGLKFIKKLDVDHVSYYDLIIEEKTKLLYDLKNNKISLLNEDEQYKFSKIINQKLKTYSFNRYEFSNYSKRKKESIHNLLYWNLDEYLGIGLNAHSFINSKRYFNTSNLKEYIKDPINSKEFEETDLKKEYLLMGLRKIKGVSIKEYNLKFKENLFITYPFISKYIKLGILKICGDNLSFTKKGINVSNIVFREVV